MAIPSPPDIALPTFDGTLPVTDLTPPEEAFLYNEETYQSDLKDALLTKLYNDVTLGGTGLTDEVYETIKARGIDGLDYELEKAINRTDEVWASRGYELPPGGFDWGHSV